jgi:protein-L-isoaspartate(D-aspartate) O-methyltransferase
MWTCLQASIVAAIMAMAAVGAATLQPKRTSDTAMLISWTPPRFEEKRQERDRMVDEIRSYGLKDERVLAAMSAVPRHEFVPQDLRHRAYADSPMPIGYGQTISQPYIVAEMTRLLKLDKDSSVLEVGTGSAYQAAVLTHFTPHVYSIEIIEPLATAAEARLRRLGYTGRPGIWNPIADAGRKG